MHISFTNLNAAVLCVRFFLRTIVNKWNSLSATVNFTSVASLKQSLKRVDLSPHLKYTLLSRVSLWTICNRLTHLRCTAVSCIEIDVFAAFIRLLGRQCT